MFRWVPGRKFQKRCGKPRIYTLGFLSFTAQRGLSTKIIPPSLTIAIIIISKNSLYYIPRLLSSSCSRRRRSQRVQLSQSPILSPRPSPIILLLATVFCYALLVTPHRLYWEAVLLSVEASPPLLDPCPTSMIQQPCFLINPPPDNKAVPSYRAVSD